MDERLFTLINRQWTSPLLDRVMVIASSFELWWPVLALVLALVAWRGGMRARWMLVTLAVALVVGDALVDNPLKHAIHRLRPWQAMAGVREVDLDRHAHPRLLAAVHPVDVNLTTAPLDISKGDPHPGRSFPSSHVVNNFSAAAILTVFYRRRGALYFLPATLVAYSRVYVGAHWPSDVVISAVLAIGLALLVAAGTRWAAARLLLRLPGQPA